MTTKRCEKYGQVFCAYLKDNELHPVVEPSKKYYPVLEYFKMDSRIDVKMLYSGDVSKTIETYDPVKKPNKKPSHYVMSTDFIDVTSNEIMPIPDNVILNLTNDVLTVYDHYNIPHAVYPIYNTNLRDEFQNKILIFTIHKVTNPKIPKLMENESHSYIERILDELRSKPEKALSPAEREQLKVLEVADKLYHETALFSDRHRVSSEQEKISNINSYKIVTVLELDNDDFVENKIGSRPEDTVLHIISKNLYITRRSVYRYFNIPVLDSFGFINTKSMPGTYSIYIVDNKDMLSPRYTCIADKVIKIKSVKIPTSQEGLYIAEYNEDGGISLTFICDLDNIDKVKYIYKTQEEALNGADKLTLMDKEMKMKELNLQKELLEAKKENEKLKMDYEKLSRDLSIERERAKIDFEAMAKELELKYSRMKRELEEKSLEDKWRYDRDNYRMRNSYEEAKYARDTTSDTLKLVGTVVTAMAGMYLIASRK